jgi:deoxyribonuclease-4
VLFTERAGRVFGQRVAVTLAVGGTHEGRNDLDVPVVDLSGLAPEVGETEVDVELEQVDSAWAPWHTKSVETGSDNTPRDRYGSAVGELRFGPADLPDAPSFAAAMSDLRERGYSACEIGFVGGFWLDYDEAAELRAAAEAADVVLSVHAPLAAFMGHADDGKKFKMALGMLDHTAGLAKAVGAEVIVFHPGFLLGRERADAIDAVVRQLGLLRERLEAKDRLVPFGVEVMGRVRDLGTADDVIEISRRLDGWIRPVLDFAHMHATSDGAFTDTNAFATVLEAADDVMEPGAPFHVHFSDIAYANRNETKHLPYGQGTLRAEPLGEALAGFERPATVISESPDEASHQAIRAALESAAADSAKRRSKTSASSSPRSRSS